MAYLHNNPEKDAFSLKTGNVTIDKNGDREGYELLKKFEQQKSEIHSVWNSKDKRFGKDDIRENYLDFFSGMREEQSEECLEEYKIISIPGGGFLYHHTLISKEHIGLFDVEKSTEDYRRYAFGKAHTI